MRYSKIIFIIGALIFVLSCSNDDVNPIGYNLVKDNGQLDTLLISSPCADTYMHTEKPFLADPNRSHGIAPILYLGTWNGITARMLIKADFDAVLQDTTSANNLNNLTQVLDANLILQYAGQVGEGALELKVYEVSEAWNEYFSSWENAEYDTVYTPWSTPGGEFSAEPIFSTTISDTLDSLNVELPASIVETWIKAYDDTTETYHNYGVIFVADDATCMKKFYSRDEVESDLHPILTFDYEYNGVDSVAQSTATLRIDKPTNQGKDTFIANRYFEEPNGNENTITIANGFFIRGMMKFEIPPSIPKDATINLAQLTINVLTDYEDSTQSMYVRAYELKEEWQEDSAGENTDLKFYALTDGYGRDISPGVSIASDDNKVRININPYMQDWISNPSENFGLLLRSGSEALNFSSMEIYSREAAEQLRPTLKIVYTLPPVYEW